VRLSCELAPTPVMVNADANPGAQMVGNLLQQRSQVHSRGGRAHISVAVEAGQGVIRVVDNGVGMAPDTVAHLFQPFMQADQSLDRSKGDWGLGLALIKGLIEMHGGSIQAQKRGLGKGAGFVVRLPLDGGAASDKPAERERGPRVCRRVLIIEDNLRRGRKPARGPGTERARGRGRLQWAGRPGQGSFIPSRASCAISVCQAWTDTMWRGDSAGPALRSAFLVALSGYALPEDLERAAAAGFQHHLAKPPSVTRWNESCRSCGNATAVRTGLGKEVYAALLGHPPRGILCTQWPFPVALPSSVSLPRLSPSSDGRKVYGRDDFAASPVAGGHVHLQPLPVYGRR